MSKIRADLGAVVVLPGGKVLNPGDEVPEGVALGNHVLEGESAEAQTDPGDEVPEGIALPKGNAARAEWEAYASALGVEIEDDWKVADIKAAVAAEERE